MYNIITTSRLSLSSSFGCMSHHRSIFKQKDICREWHCLAMTLAWDWRLCRRTRQGRTCSKHSRNRQIKMVMKTANDDDDDSGNERDHDYWLRYENKINANLFLSFFSFNCRFSPAHSHNMLHVLISSSFSFAFVAVDRRSRFDYFYNERASRPYMRVAGTLGRRITSYEYLHVLSSYVSFHLSFGVLSVCARYFFFCQFRKW